MMIAIRNSKSENLYSFFVLMFILGANKVPQCINYLKFLKI